MLKRFLYIVLLMVLIPSLLYAKNNLRPPVYVFFRVPAILMAAFQQRDTINAKGRHQEEDKKKIKEVAKAKKLPKPEKVEVIDPATGKLKIKPQRQRRPEGVERPPEIPRRNGN